MWIGTSDGLGHWRDGKLKLYTIKDGLRQVRDNPLRMFTTEDGLPTLNIRSVLPNPDGSVWLNNWGAALRF